MPRPTSAQLCYGILTVVAATVALLAVSGAESLLSITVTVVLGLTLGTAVTARSMAPATPAAARERVTTAGPLVAARAERPRAGGPLEAEYASPSAAAGR